MKSGIDNLQTRRPSRWCYAVVLNTVKFTYDAYLLDLKECRTKSLQVVTNDTCEIKQNGKDFLLVVSYANPVKKVTYQIDREILHRMKGYDMIVDTLTFTSKIKRFFSHPKSQIVFFKMPVCSDLEICVQPYTRDSFRADIGDEKTTISEKFGATTRVIKNLANSSPLLFKVIVDNTLYDDYMNTMDLSKDKKPLPKWIWWVVGIIIAVVVIVVLTQTPALEMLKKGLV